jgi:hypothetical protein
MPDTCRGQRVAIRITVAIQLYLFMRERDEHLADRPAVANHAHTLKCSVLKKSAQKFTNALLHVLVIFVNTIFLDQSGECNWQLEKGHKLFSSFGCACKGGNKEVLDSFVGQKAACLARFFPACCGESRTGRNTVRHAGAAVWGCVADQENIGQHQLPAPFNRLVLFAATEDFAGIRTMHSFATLFDCHKQIE